MGDTMSKELTRTYIPFCDWKEKSKQIEYTEKTPLLDSDGKLLAKGWARKMFFYLIYSVSFSSFKSKITGLSRGV